MSAFARVVLAVAALTGCASPRPRVVEPVEAVAGAPDEGVRPGTRYRYEVEVDGDLSVIDLVVLPASGEAVAALSKGDDVAIRFRTRPGRLGEDLAAALALGVSGVSPERRYRRPFSSIRWLPDADAIAWASSVVARAGAAFPESWSGRPFAPGSRWSGDGIAVRAGDSCEVGAWRGSELLLTLEGRAEVSACVAPELELPLSIEGRAIDGVVRSARLTRVRAFAPGPADALAGVWLNVTPRVSAFPRGQVLRTDGTTVSFVWRIPEGPDDPDPPPASFCEDGLPSEWVWDGARVLLGGDPGRAATGGWTYQRAGQGDGARLVRRLQVDPSPERDHTELRRIDARSRGPCDGDVWPSRHEALLGAGPVPATLELEGRDELGDTPLTWAAAHGRLDLVTELLRRGARIDVSNRVPRGPVLAAASGGHLDVVKALVPAPPTSPDVRDDVTAALGWAARIGRLDIASHLLAMGAEVNGCGPRKEAPSTRRCGVPAIVVAAGGGNVEAVAWLLAQGADPRGPEDSGHSRALVIAARGGHDEAVSLLLERGARPGRPGPEQWRAHPPIAAAMNGRHFRVAGRLAAASGLEPLEAARSCDANLLTALLAFRPQAARGPSRPGGGPTLLQAVARCTELAAVAAVLDAGGDPNATSEGERDPPLAIALRAGSSANMELLLARGARVGDGALLTAAAVAADRRDLYDLLVRAGASPLPGRGRGEPAPRSRREGGPLPLPESPFDEEDPGYARAGDVPPSEVEPGCLESRVRAVAGPVPNREVAFRFVVGRDGRMSQVEVLTIALGPRQEEEVRRAVRGCSHRPGTDSAGRPRAFWVARTVRPASTR